MNLKIIMLVICGLLCIEVQAVDIKREVPFILANTHHISLKSEQTGAEHELIIALPYSYDSNSNKRYPVLYFADGYWDMPLLTATYGNLIYDNLAPEFIMVGFSYPKNKNYEIERGRDFTPVKISEGTGGSLNFYNFVVNTVVPLIEKNYRADPNERALGGVSLGGLFALTSMYINPEFFDRYIAISPGLLSYEKYINEVDKEYRKKHDTLNARVFVSYGSDEYKPFREAIARYQRNLAQRKYKGLALKNVVMDGLRHTTVKGEGYAKGVIWAWKDIAPAGPSGLEKAMVGRP